MPLHKSLLLLLSIALLTPCAHAKDTLDDVLQRLVRQQQQTRHFGYHETRTLQLLAQPWQADGDLFLSRRQMVIAQRSPTPVFTVISAERMLHIDPGQHIHHSLVLDQPFAVPGMEPISQLLLGSTTPQQLRQQYRLSLDSDAQRWTLHLSPRWPLASPFSAILLSGDDGAEPDQLLQQNADGDHSEWRLTPLSHGPTATRQMQRVLDRIAGY